MFLKNSGHFRLVGIFSLMYFAQSQKNDNDKATYSTLESLYNEMGFENFCTVGVIKFRREIGLPSNLMESVGSNSIYSFKLMKLCRGKPILNCILLLFTNWKSQILGTT